MTEEFLHFIWKFRLFHQPNLQSTSQQHIEVINTGMHNTNAGPDFLNAKVRIADTLWAGNIEIHVHSSDWEKHNHQNDDAYKNVILHVVFNHDKKIIRNKTQEEIPTLELADNIPETIYNRYLDILKTKSWIPCKSEIKQIDTVILNTWLERILVERMERKSGEIIQNFKLNNNNWEQTFYQFLAKNFGFKVNDVPFELLAKSLPQKYLAKHRNNPFQLEAMLMGQAGLLNKTFGEDYPILLKKEYTFLKNKFNLHPIDAHLWRFLRIRPVNFPNIRISQFADLASKSSGLFSNIIEAENIAEIRNLFDIKASSYWDTHYNFDKTSPRRCKKMGENSIQNILINTVVPFLFAFSIEKNTPQLKQKALHYLLELKKENNSIIKKWETIGIDVKDAFTSQALIELKNNYCTYKRCLSCQIGNTLIKNN